MSIKRRIEHKYLQIFRVVRGLSLPRWMNGVGLRVFLLVAFIFMFGSYFYKINAMATVGYQMRDLENKISELEIENQRISVEIARESSMTNIVNRLAGLKMVSVSDIKYIQITDNIIAKK